MTNTELRSFINQPEGGRKIAGAMVGPVNTLVATKGIRSLSLCFKHKQGSPSILTKKQGTSCWSVSNNAEGEDMVTTHLQSKENVAIEEVEIVSEVLLEDRTSDELADAIVAQICEREQEYASALCKEADQQGVEKIMLVLGVRRDIDIIFATDERRRSSFIAYELVTISAVPYEEQAADASVAIPEPVQTKLLADTEVVK